MLHRVMLFGSWAVTLSLQVCLYSLTMSCSGEGVFVETRTSRKEEGSPKRETASFLPQENIFPAEPTKTWVRKPCLAPVCLICHIKENGSKGEWCFSVSLWGNASLNTSWTAALSRAANRDIEVLSFARSYWIRAVRNAETKRGHHSRLIASPWWVIAGKITIFTNISCGAWNKTLTKHKKVVERMDVQISFLFRQSHHHRSQPIFVILFGLPCNSILEVNSFLVSLQCMRELLPGWLERRRCQKLVAWSRTSGRE